MRERARDECVCLSMHFDIVPLPPDDPRLAVAYADDGGALAYVHGQVHVHVCQEWRERERYQNAHARGRV